MSLPATVRPQLLFALIGLVALVLYGVFVTPTLGDVGGDSAQYLALAESLVNGTGYRDVHLPAAPAHAHYPPGFPILLMPIAASFGPQAYLPAKALVAFAAALTLLLAASLLHKKHGTAISLLAIAVAGCNLGFVLQALRIQSEMPFAALVFGSLLAHERGTARSRWLAVTLAAAAFSVRVLGVALIVALAFSEIRRDRLRSWPRLLVLALAPIAFAVWTQSVGDQGTWSYLAEAQAASGGQWIAHALEGFAFYLKELGSICVAPASAWPWLQWSLSALVLLGFARAVHMALGRSLYRALHRSKIEPPSESPESDRVLASSSRGVPELFFAATLVLAAIAPMRTVRYLVPLAPLIAFYFVDALFLIARTGLHFVARRKPVELRFEPNKIAIFVTALALIANVWMLAQFAQRRFDEREIDAPLALRNRLDPIASQHWEWAWFLGDDAKGQALVRAHADWLHLIAAIRHDVVELPASALLAADKPRFVSYLSGRPCVALPAPGPSALAELHSRGVTHVIDNGVFARSLRQCRPLRAAGASRVLAVRKAELLALQKNASPK